MMDPLQNNHLVGLAIGLATFLVIGLFHPLVIKGEYYFGTRIWWAFLLFGLANGVFSLFVNDLFLSTLAGVVAFSSLWSIIEVFEQEKRVKKGWFPENPGRARKNGDSH